MTPISLAQYLYQSFTQADDTSTDKAALLAEAPSFAVLFDDDSFEQSINDSRQAITALFPDSENLRQKFIAALAEILQTAVKSPEEDIASGNYDHPIRQGLQLFLLSFIRELYYNNAFMNAIFASLLEIAMQQYQDPLSVDELKQMLELRSFQEAVNIDLNYNDNTLLAMVASGQVAEALMHAAKRQNSSERYSVLFSIYERLVEQKKDPTACINLLIATAKQIENFPVFPRLILHIAYLNLDDALKILEHVTDTSERDSILLELIVRLSWEDNISTERLLELLNMIDDWRVHTQALVPIVLKVGRTDPEEADRMAKTMRRMVIEPIKYFLDFRFGFYKYPDERKYEPVWHMYEFAMQITDPLTKSVALSETAHFVEELRNYPWDGDVSQTHADFLHEIPDYEIQAMSDFEIAKQQVDFDIEQGFYRVDMYLESIDHLRDVKRALRLAVRMIRPYAEKSATAAVNLLGLIKHRALVRQTPLALIEAIADDHPENALIILNTITINLNKAQAYATIASAYARRGDDEKATEHFETAKQIAAEISGESKSTLLAYIAERMIKFDPEEAENLLAQAKQATGVSRLAELTRDTILERIAVAAASRDKNFALKLAENLTHEYNRISLYIEMIDLYPELLEEIRTIALEYLKNSKSGSSRVSLSLKLADLSEEADAKKIYKEAVSYARSLKQKKAADALIPLAAYTSDEMMREQLFSEAESHAKSQRDFYDQDYTLSIIALEKSRFDLQKGLEAANAINESRFRAEGLVRIVLDQAERSDDIEELLQEVRQVVDDLSDQWIQSTELIKLMPLYLKRGEDPETLLDAIKYEESKQYAYKAVAQHIIEQDPEKALAYLENISDETQRNRMLREVLITLAKTNPAMAIELSDHITVPQEKLNAILMIARQNLDSGNYQKALSMLPVRTYETFLAHLTKNLPESLKEHYPDQKNLFLELMDITLKTASHVQHNWTQYRDMLSDYLPAEEAN